MTLDYSGEGLQFEMNKVDLLFNRALALKEVSRISEAQLDVSQARKLVDRLQLSSSLSSLLRPLLSLT